jgi:predicted transposase/invertase (TIGR01784 family)
MVFVELPKFKKTLDELKTIQDKWIYFMREVDDMKVEPENYKTNKVFNSAFELANKINLTEEELEEIEKESIYIQDKR